jgi:hypothetical protein
MEVSGHLHVPAALTQKKHFVGSVGMFEKAVCLLHAAE